MHETVCQMISVMMPFFLHVLWTMDIGKPMFEDEMDAIIERIVEG